MKIILRSFAFFLFTCALCALAQFTTERNPANRIGEAGARKIASRLVVGMREADAIQLLATNGLRINGLVLHSTNWSLMCCYNDGSTPYVKCFELNFCQKPMPSGVLTITNEFGHRQVVRTNGILQSAILDGGQIAKTNAP